MGDTGSLALGMALGCIAIVTKTEVISLIIGGLFVIEALSVMIQVFYFKRTKKRLFLMAPLHHHFEKRGWSEGGRAFLDHLGMLRCCRILYLLRPNDGSLETGIICPSERKDRP